MSQSADDHQPPRAERPPRGRRRSFALALGPGLIVTASFVGPGTVTTSTLAGADHGFALLWAVVFSILATIVLQEMAARLGLVTGEGLGEAIRTTIDLPWVRALFIALIVAALGIGSAVYAQGDLTGTALGLAEITGLPVNAIPAGVVVIIALLLASGRYRVVQGVLGALVALMAVVFLVTAVAVRPDLGEVVRGAVIPSIPPGAILTTIALVGTTVVPYNLFLHSSTVLERYPHHDPETTRESLRAARIDTFVSIAIGGLITIAIMATAAAALAGTGVEVEDAAAMAGQLEPLLGPAAGYFFATGLFAAGLTSAIAVSLGAAYAVSTSLGWGSNLRSWRFRGLWAAVLLYGAITATVGADPVGAIVFAQAANGVLLPIIVIALLVIMNRRGLLGAHANRAWHNVLGVLVAAIATGLGIYTILDGVGLL